MSNNEEVMKHQDVKMAEERTSDAQIQKLKNWTEKPFPVGLKEDSKTPFLHRFSRRELHEGLIYAVTARKALIAELNGLLELGEKKYTDDKYEMTFKSVMDKIEKATEVEYDGEALVDEDVLEEEDHATAVRGWVGSEEYHDGRVLRYTICVISRRNDGLGKHIKEFKRSGAVAERIV